jgi:hypothetical protein
MIHRVAVSGDRRYPEAEVRATQTALGRLFKKRLASGGRGAGAATAQPTKPVFEPYAASPSRPELRLR